MLLSVRHEIRFAVLPGTAHAVQHLLLRPADTQAQKILEWTITTPGIGQAAWFTDAFGNAACLVSQTRPEEDLVITVNGLVETADTSGVVGKIEKDAPIALFRRITAHTKPNGNLVNRMKAQQKTGMSRLETLHSLMARLHEAQEPTGDTEADSPEIVAEDHAHVFIATARGMDIPARFVSGYLLRADGASTRMHVWAEAFDEQLGWIGFDPSANLCPTDNYVRVATALDAETAMPVRRVPEFGQVGDESIRIAQITAANQQ